MMESDQPYGFSQVPHSLAKSIEREVEKSASESAHGSRVPGEKELGGALSEDYPKGGWTGWATAVGAFLVQFSTYGYSISFGVYQDFYAQTFITNETSSTIAWIGSINSFLFEICGLVGGRLYDRGYFYHLLYGASFLQAFSLFMLSLAHPGNFYQVFLAQGIGSGCAAGLLYVPSMAVLSQFFNKRLEKAMTFASSGAYLGAVVHPIMLNNTINGRLGFANGVRASAGLITGLLVVASLLMRTRQTPSESRPNFLVAVKRCSQDTAFIFGCLGLSISVVAFYYPLFYLQLDSVRHGLGNTFSFYSLVIMNASSFFGQLSSTVLVGIILFGMTGVHTVAGVVVFGVFYGYFSGIFLALWTPVMTLLTPDLSELGVRMGVACAAMAFGGLIGPPISGALLTPAYIWWRGAVFNGIAASLGCTMFIVMQRILVRRSKTRVASGSESVPSTELSPTTQASDASPEPSATVDGTR